MFLLTGIVLGHPLNCAFAISAAPTDYIDNLKQKIADRFSRQPQNVDIFRIDDHLFDLSDPLLDPTKNLSLTQITRDEVCRSFPVTWLSNSLKTVEMEFLESKQRKNLNMLVLLSGSILSEPPVYDLSIRQPSSIIFDSVKNNNYIPASVSSPYVTLQSPYLRQTSSDWQSSSANLGDTIDDDQNYSPNSNLATKKLKFEVSKRTIVIAMIIFIVILAVLIGVVVTVVSNGNAERQGGIVEPNAATESSSKSSSPSTLPLAKKSSVFVATNQLATTRTTVTITTTTIPTTTTTTTTAIAVPSPLTCIAVTFQNLIFESELQANQLCDAACQAWSPIAKTSSFINIPVTGIVRSSCGCTAIFPISPVGGCASIRPTGLTTCNLPIKVAGGLINDVDAATKCPTVCSTSAELTYSKWSGQADLVGFSCICTADFFGGCPSG